MFITGMILAVLSVVCLFISESGIRSAQESTFQSNLNALYQNLEQQASLSHNWIRQMEYSYQMSIQITDNGVPLFYQSVTKSGVSDALWEAVREKALTEYGLDVLNSSSSGVLARHEEFPIKDADGRSYTASVALLPRTGGCVGVTLVHPLQSMNSRIWGQRLAFLGADLAALVILGIFYWFFTARMMRPLAENRKKQMQFVAAASHELRSPLTVILSNIAAVKNGILPNDVSFLNTLSSEGSRMSRLIGDMLQLAAADNHTWSMQPAPVELDTLLLQTWENYESMAGARGLKWEISLPDGRVPRCVCDEERIRQLLSILVDNAFCYTPEGGCVRLSLTAADSSEADVRREGAARRPFGGRKLWGGITERHGEDAARRPWLRKPMARAGSCFCITVSDNGPGIPDEQKAAVFERFHRLDKSRTDKSHFGLGLCIAREIALLHKGELLLTDTPGGGATFTLLLPAG